MLLLQTEPGQKLAVARSLSLQGATAREVCSVGVGVDMYTCIPLSVKTKWALNSPPGGRETDRQRQQESL